MALLCGFVCLFEAENLVFCILLKFNIRCFSSYHRPYSRLPGHTKIFLEERSIFICCEQWAASVVPKQQHTVNLLCKGTGSLGILTWVLIGSTTRMGCNRDVNRHSRTPLSQNIWHRTRVSSVLKKDLKTRAACLRPLLSCYMVAWLRHWWRIYIACARSASGASVRFSLCTSGLSVSFLGRTV